MAQPGYAQNLPHETAGAFRKGSHLADALFRNASDLAVIRHSCPLPSLAPLAVQPHPARQLHQCLVDLQSQRRHLEEPACRGK